MRKLIWVLIVGLVYLLGWVGCERQEPKISESQTTKSEPEKTMIEKALSSQQQEDLESYLLHDAGFLQAAYRLQKAIVTPEAEALTNALVEHLLHPDPKTRSNVRSLLERRARKGIKGEYFERLVPVCLNELETDNFIKSPESRIGRNASVIFEYLKLYPNDKDISKRSITWAKQNARIDLMRDTIEKRLNAIHASNCARLIWSWRILIEQGLIKAGMSLRDLEDILGKPTRKSESFVEWYYRSMMHVNPCFYAWTKDGIVTRFKQVLR